MIRDLGAHDVSNRFAEEVGYLRKYVVFIEEVSSLRGKDLGGLNGALKRQGFQIEIFPHDWRRYAHPYSAEELSDIAEKLRGIEPEIASMIRKLEARLDDEPGPEGLSRIDVRSEIGEWIQGVSEMVEDPLSIDEPERLRHLIVDHDQRGRAEMGSDYELMSDEEIYYVVKGGMYIHRVNLYKELDLIRSSIERLEFHARMSEPKSALNALRQGFILLMTAFDASVFDLVRIALKADFFALIGQFGRQDKVSLEELGGYRNFESWRDALIEKQLKARYLKDLLGLLKGIGVQCLDSEAGQKDVELVELVLRRNVHVHSRGVVDERYLERDREGRPRFNLHGLRVGEVAHIDQAYWERAVTLTSECVNRLAAWVGSLAERPDEE